MLEFRWHRRKADRTPIISDMDIIRFTEEVLSDYKPEHLEVPDKLDPEHFIERYLGATIDYQDIYYPKDESPIAGATIFNCDRVAVFDKERNMVRNIFVEPGTIILDNSVLDNKFWGFAEFTAMHESGHFQMHHEVYDDREFILDCCRDILADLDDTTALDEQIADCLNECEVISDMNRRLLEQNSSTVMDQEEFKRKHESYVKAYEKKAAQAEKLQNLQDERKNKADMISAFMFEIHEMEGMLQEFDAELWLTTIDCVKVYKDGRMRFVFKIGTEVTV